MKKNLIFILTLLNIQLFSQSYNGLNPSQEKVSGENIDNFDCMFWDKGEILLLPVVFHIVSESPEMIKDEYIYDQLDILNNAFRRKNKTSKDVPFEFAHLRADAGIEFCIATQDPAGNTKICITRTKTSKPYFNWIEYPPPSEESDTLFTLSPLWPTDKFINIYIAYFDKVPSTFTSNQVSGYAFPNPLFPVHEKAFVAVDIRTLPSLPRNLNKEKDIFAVQPGSVLIHEIGHYLGLQHTFGDCNDDDGINDTPRHKSSNQGGCPKHPISSDCDSVSKNIMFMNYMNYCDCRNMFTIGQISKMRCRILSDTRLQSANKNSSSTCIGLWGLNTCGNQLFGNIVSKTFSNSFNPTSQKSVKITWGDDFIVTLPNSVPPKIDNSKVYVRYKKYKSSSWKEKNVSMDKNEVILNNLDPNSIYDFYLLKKCGINKITESIYKSFKTPGIENMRTN